MLSCGNVRACARDATHTDLEPLLHPCAFRFVLTCDSDVCGSASIAHHVRRVMELFSQRKIGHALYAMIVLLPCAQASHTCLDGDFAWWSNDYAIVLSYGGSKLESDGGEASTDVHVVENMSRCVRVRARMRSTLVSQGWCNTCACEVYS